MPRTRRFLDVPLVYALATLAIFSATRLGLALWTGTSAIPLSEWPVVFAKGLWFDLVVLVALLAPVWLYEAALPDRWRATRTHGPSIRMSS